MAAPCCSNTVTPKMIRKGEMKVGDRIYFDDVPVSAPAAESAALSAAEEPVSAVFAEENSPSDTVPVQNTMPPSWSQQQAVPPQMPNQMQSQWPNQMQPQWPQNQQQWTQKQQRTAPLTYDQMTPYMNLTQMSPGQTSPMFTVPQTPMTTQQFQETIDSTDVQSYLGFMRTQLGRYMRIEQLMGSNNIEQRFGFLVGLGTNYIILQEITSGNIMVVDLFTIRLTYIYYSDPVVPPGVPY